MTTYDLKRFIRHFEKVVRDDKARENIALMAEAMAMDWLAFAKSNVIDMEAVDTRLLLNSLDKGHGENIFDLNMNRLTLDVGTNVEYASYVNDGHWVRRNGASSSLTERSSTGRNGWVEGRPFADAADLAIEMIIEQTLDKQMQKWLDRTFG